MAWTARDSLLHHLQRGICDNGTEYNANPTTFTLGRRYPTLQKPKQSEFGQNDDGDNDEGDDGKGDDGKGDGDGDGNDNDNDNENDNDDAAADDVAVDRNVIGRLIVQCPRCPFRAPNCNLVIHLKLHKAFDDMQKSIERNDQSNGDNNADGVDDVGGGGADSHAHQHLFPCNDCSLAWATNQSRRSHYLSEVCEEGRIYTSSAKPRRKRAPRPSNIVDHVVDNNDNNHNLGNNHNRDHGENDGAQTSFPNATTTTTATASTTIPKRNTIGSSAPLSLPPCTRCPSGSNKACHAQAHVMFDTQDQQTTILYLCETCQLAWANTASLKLHLKRGICDKGMEYNADPTTFKFARRSSIRTSTKNVEKLPKRCPRCNFTYPILPSGSVSRPSHQVFHDNYDTKPFKYRCTKCEMAWFSKAVLVKHYLKRLCDEGREYCNSNGVGDGDGDNNADFKDDDEGGGDDNDDDDNQGGDNSSDDDDDDGGWKDYKRQPDVLGNSNRDSDDDGDADEDTDADDEEDDFFECKMEDLSD